MDYNTGHTCIKCSGFGTNAKNLIPIVSKDGKVFAVTCIHRIKLLKKWRRLTDEEKVLWEKMSEGFICALQEASSKH